MKNIHIIPTENPSRLYSYKNKLGIANRFQCGSDTVLNQHIYVTSDEEIKIDEYYLCKLSMKLLKCIGDEYFNNIDEKKIILTTDQDLIKDGVQKIDDDFLEWFVKNPSCEEVEIKEKQHFQADKSKRKNPLNGVYYSYKIIIPKEESKQESVFENAKLSLKKYLFDNKEKVAKDLEQMREWSNTDKQDPLEQAAKEYAEMHLDVSGNLGKYLVKAVFQDGAQWQQERMYSEEDVKNAFLEGWELRSGKLTFVKAKNKWFNEFKKK